MPVTFILLRFVAAFGSQCNNASFPVDLNGKQMDGLQGVKSAHDVDQCRLACCAQGEKCEVFQWSYNPAEKPNCWIGKTGPIIRNGPYSARGRGPAPPTPPPPPPPCTPSSSKSFVIRNDSFVKDGCPFTLRSGSLHYFRVPASYWVDRMQRMKAMGLNAVTMYVAWNWHEQDEGQIHGLGNVTGFLDAAKQTGMLVLFRPGPYEYKRVRKSLRPRHPRPTSIRSLCHFRI